MYLYWYRIFIKACTVFDYERCVYPVISNRDLTASRGVPRDVYDKLFFCS